MKTLAYYLSPSLLEYHRMSVAYHEVRVEQVQRGESREGPNRVGARQPSVGEHGRVLSEHEAPSGFHLIARCDSDAQSRQASADTLGLLPVVFSDRHLCEGVPLRRVTFLCERPLHALARARTPVLRDAGLRCAPPKEETHPPQTI